MGPSTVLLWETVTAVHQAAPNPEFPPPSPYLPAVAAWLAIISPQEVELLAVDLLHKGTIAAPVDAPADVDAQMPADA
eukprot:1027167-Pelagomonas_calceolata.AAC.2